MGATSSNLNVNFLTGSTIVMVCHNIDTMNTCSAAVTGHAIAPYQVVNRKSQACRACCPFAGQPRTQMCLLWYKAITEASTLPAPSRDGSIQTCIPGLTPGSTTTAFGKLCCSHTQTLKHYVSIIVSVGQVGLVILVGVLLVPKLILRHNRSP